MSENHVNVNRLRGIFPLICWVLERCGASLLMSLASCSRPAAHSDSANDAAPAQEISISDEPLPIRAELDSGKIR
jgi:hypothetical protein